MLFLYYNNIKKERGKSMFKKLMCVVTVLCILSSVLAGTVSAKVIGTVYSTDITAYIDNLIVPSYNIDGYTCIMVRDLENYGYTVSWNASLNRVDFYRNFAIMKTPLVPEVDTLPTGTKLFDALETEVKVYFRNQLVPSYNIGGKTLVRLRDLETVSPASYDSVNKRAFISTIEAEYFEDELEYFHNYFYNNLFFLQKADIEQQKMLDMADRGIYSAETVAQYKKFCDSIDLNFNTFKEYHEPYGFNNSALELWWAMVNLRYASESLLSLAEKMNSGTDYSVEKEDFKQYRADSQEQRQTALECLATDMLSVVFSWD